MATSCSRSDIAKVGEVFTPVEWAEWLLDKWGIYQGWITGATVCDPTAGRGAFAMALLRMAKTRGIVPSQELLSRLTLIELHEEHLCAFKDQARQELSIEFPSSQLLGRDVITDPPDAQFDFLVGNPPWMNFTELPSGYKEKLKPYFVSERLVPDRKKVLLGSSRVDVAALVLKVAIGRLLRPGGVGCFFLPLSLFTGDDAHRGFRDYQANNRAFAVDEICEFNNTKVFHGIGTSYCCARFKMDQRQEFPVQYFRESDHAWVEHRAIPLKNHSDPWRVLANDEKDDFEDAIGLTLRPDQKPRQGVNTCGANQIFIFDKKPEHLPEKLLFPLATKDIWKHGDLVPKRWILLPYDQASGRPLSWQEIECHPELQRHLTEAQKDLSARKGTLIQSAITKGHWWSLLGIGPYSFAPYKIIWEAYGKNDFRPVVLPLSAGQPWQANQAMHAYIPCWNKADAQSILTKLKHPGIQSLLQQLNGDGKCNWAQPGKIKKILSFGQPTLVQLSLFE